MASNGITTRRNACQMFGIYRSRTPEKMELKPNKQTRACFLTAVITGVALVVGLSLLDVSTNASNIKLAPVLHLKRHRQDLLIENTTNINIDNKSIFNGRVKEVTKISIEDTTNTINTAATMGTTTTSTESDLKADVSQRTARTQLFPVESLKMNRNSIVKDYFIDGRHDPKSLGYYILQKQNGEYYLRNNSDPVWGTRIQRRFSNRIYPTQPNYGYKNSNNDNIKYIKRTDNLYYETNNHQKIKQNVEVKRNTDHVFHLSPFRRLSSTKTDEIDNRKQNNDYQNKDTIVNYENQLSPYEFTPIPLFSNSYAQLDPYKNNVNIKSVQDVMKYLTVPPKISRSSTTSMPRMVRTESNFIETTLKQENITNPNNNNKKRRKGIRFSGTYEVPIEPEDLKTGGSGLIETLLPPPIPTPFAKPYSGNIGTLINDPFANFRPSDPAEINHQLSPISSVLKNTSYKQKEIGSMFRNNIATSTIPPNRFFPKPPFGTRKRPRPVNTNVTPSTTNNGHTVEVYKPASQNDNMYYKETNNNNYGSPSLNMRPPRQNVKRKRKPVSVTLDIYPITMDYDQDNSPSDNKNNVINPSIGKFKNGDSELEWISPTMVSNDDQDSDDTSSSNNDSHMVVHLNLFPKGITRKQRNRTGRRPVWNNSQTPRSMYTQKSADDTIDFPSSYEDYFISKTNNEKEEMNKNVNKEYMDYDFEEIPEDEIPIHLYDQVLQNPTTFNNKKNDTNLNTHSKFSNHFIETKNKSSNNFKNNNNSKIDESINSNHQMETSFSDREIIQNENVYSSQNSENGFNNTTNKNIFHKYSNNNLSQKTLTIQNDTENSYDNYYDYAEDEQS